jgi:hypothetical protein
MNTIETIALKTKFAEESINSLMEVVNHTPKPSMALEILLGIYEEPILSPKGVDGDGVVLTMISVDHWTDQVKYQYEKEETKTFYIDKDTDNSLVNIDNIEEYKVPWGDNSKNVTLKTGKIVTSSSYCSVDSWLTRTERLKEKGE